MKKQEIEQALDSIDKLKQFSDAQTYNISSTINKFIIKIEPILREELDRMNTEKVTVNCPKLDLITFEKEMADASVEYLINKMNDKIAELVSSDYKIIDFGLAYIDKNYSCYIKYTN